MAEGKTKEAAMLELAETMGWPVECVPEPERMHCEWWWMSLDGVVYAHVCDHHDDVYVKSPRGLLELCKLQGKQTPVDVCVGLRKRLALALAHANSACSQAGFDCVRCERDCENRGR